MKRETISQGVGNISESYIQEAAGYVSGRKYTGAWKRPFLRNAVAAILVLAVFMCGVILLSPSHDATITVYAYGTDEEITAAGAVIGTGEISDIGEMRGKPLMFYLIGRDIATVRFSCRNQLLSFVDWTEKRDEYGNAQNFTVTYGKEESEYYYLTIDWVPEATIRELTDNGNSSIATLPDELREDIIVMEIAFGNGETAVKAIRIFLQDDGTFFACFDDYEIKDSDTFIKRPDSEAISYVTEAQEEETVPSPTEAQEEETVPSPAEVQGEALTEEQIEDAKQAALAYYEGTVFSVNSIEYCEGMQYGDMAGECNFTVNVSKGGVVQNPNRLISLNLEQDGWKVVNEGY